MLPEADPPITTPPDDGATVRQMVNAEQVLALIPISRTTLFRLERDKLFPQGVAITPHRKLWFEDEVIAWQKAARDPASALAKALRQRRSKKAKKAA